MKKIAVIGSRTLTDEWVLPRLSFLLNEENRGKVMVISGGARGVDNCVERYCHTWNIPLKVIRPENPEVKYDYLRRNIKIVEEADEVVALWDGKSKGTKFVIDEAIKQNKELIIIQDGRNKNNW